MDHLADRHLAVSRPRLAVLALAAALFPGWDLLRALYLSIPLSPTDVALYESRVGHDLGAVAVGVGVVLVAMAISLRCVARSVSPALTTGALVVVAGMLGMMGAAWVHDDHALHPFGPELEALATFEPPPGATHEFDARYPSDHPDVKRFWRVPGSMEEVCRAAVPLVEAWADAATVTNVLPQAATSCFFRGRRREHLVEMAFPSRSGHRSTRQR
jgi:hypothetical protein